MPAGCRVNTVWKFDVASAEKIPYLVSILNKMRNGENLENGESWEFFVVVQGLPKLDVIYNFGRHF